MGEHSPKVDQLNSSQRLLLALKEARAKLEAVERSKAEPIAIIGTACRFPGGANDPEAFWQLLTNGVDAIAKTPSDRWDVDAYYDPNPDTPGKMYTRYGGFLQQVDQFDAQFFGISPREAVRIDPQQRLLLEVTWEALENAGLVNNKQAASETGVFVGVTTNDYARLLMPYGDLSQMDAYYLTGNPLNAIAGRLSYTLGLQGPCMAIDTACSSSLVAIHTACQSLRNEECTHALAGGVNLILSPENNVALSKAKILSADGRCKTFDASADGIVRGEGCGIIVLKRLSDAIADGDNILALIRGSAVNQDGASSGFTVPNKAAQEILLRQALARARVEPSEVDYVEAHGTGTPLGDPIEIRALAAVFGEGRSLENPLKVGSVKTNIGHLESAAGVASVIKVVLSLQHQQIPQQLHLQQLNPYVDWNELPISVTTNLTAWTATQKRRIAGVSAFGASGTNAHVVLEEAPLLQPKTETTTQRSLNLLTLSAKTNEALKQLAASYETHLAANPIALEDICFSANTGRGDFKHRLAVLVSSTTEASQKLSAFAQGQEVAGIIQDQVEAATVPRIAFLFTGQGSQYVGMGRQLYETQPTFRAALDLCDEILRSQFDLPLLKVLYPQTEDADNSHTLDETAYTQPALFALEYALFQLWKSWGIEPAVVMGHSVGEYVAACVAGVFSLEDALKLIATRGRLMQALPQDGAMVAVLANPELVKAALEPFSQQVSIAAFNGPKSVVISGKREAVKSVCAVLQEQRAKTKELQVSHAFHSPLMQPMLAEFRQVANEVTFSTPQLKLISNLTGELITDEITTSEYWCNHILSPVQFAASMKTLLQEYEVFLEIGSKPTLLGMGRQCASEEGQVWLPSLRPGQDDWQQLLQSLGELYVRGVSVDWKVFNQDYQPRRVLLPTYPFQRERFWVETVNKAIEVKFLPSKEQNTDWLYEIAWQSKTLNSVQAEKPGSWFIFADQGGMGLKLAHLLESQGEYCIIVTAGSSYERLQEEHYQIDPSNPEDFQRLLQESISQYQPLCRGVVHLWSLNNQPSALEVSQGEHCGNVLHLLQSLTQTEWTESPRLWLVTQGAQAVDTLTPLQVQQSPLWGLGRVIALEHPELRCSRLDLDPSAAQEQVSNLLAELLAQDAEDQVAYRQGDRYVARLIQHTSTISAIKQRKVIRENNSYLITGGLGALGLKVAHWLVEHGAQHLVLTGRRGASEAMQQEINKLEQAGAQVLVILADISNRDDVSRLLADVKNSMPSLRGIIHAAGVLQDGMLLGQTMESFSKVMAPKVAGAWNLHTLTQDLELDFFVCFSSVSALLGSPGQGNYAAANAFMDALAHHRRALGLPAVSINWGPWRDAGMVDALSSREQARWAEQGISTIGLEPGLQILEDILTQDVAQVGVLPVDWSKFLGQLPQNLEFPFLEVFASQVEPTQTAKSEFLEQLEAAPAKEKRSLLLTHVRSLIAKVLNLKSPEEIDIYQGFTDLGMDSLMAVELKNRLQTSLEYSIPASLVFDYPTVAALVDYLAGEMLATSDAIESEVVEQIILESNFDDLSDSEAEALLLTKLASMRY
ncbi:type I polyketide synthase [Nostoc sp. LEGE 12447]|uniref:type I polyketide synthase n=1 Tax=Nostoc sp. LEGE 12447 TaxID=1828640 RepID=UPI00188343D4|nr:type I polyketide synthase [Nostoc sp. LEGE 12447]MBE9002315.1 type I polyketide synthase [Nostoc sp. LEGE 12447]